MAQSGPPAQEQRVPEVSPARDQGPGAPGQEPGLSPTRSSATRRAQAYPAEVVPGGQGPDRRVTGYEERRRLGLILAGGLDLGLSYLPAMITAAALRGPCTTSATLGCRDATWPLYVPIIGPFAQMGYLHGPGTRTGQVLLGVDGALQVVGLGLLIGGLSTRQLQRVYAGRLWPFVGAGGLGLRGAF